VAQEISRAKAVYESGNEGALRAMAREIGCDMALLRQTAQLGRLPVVNFAAGGIATQQMQLGCDGVFVGSGIFKSGNAAKEQRRLLWPPQITRMLRLWQRLVKA
jgi:pyridoxal 5'-phosphate synthase pdxS subunit